MNDLRDLLVAVRPSRRLLVAGAVVHVLAGVAALSSGVPPAVKAAFVVALGLSLAWLGFRYGWQRSPGFIGTVEWADGRWRLHTGDGRVRSARLSGGYGHPLIVILNFRLEGGWPLALALLPDAAHSENVRRLRVLLRVWRDADDAGSALG
ncbi:MAG: hypothetical protein JNK31_05955 [Candidatus Competibacter sp.]|nr:hypothetical protein [Candidatus Competibacter sp.]